jgi:hypothetical protein
LVQSSLHTEESSHLKRKHRVKLFYWSGRRLLRVAEPRSAEYMRSHFDFARFDLKKINK